MDSIKALTGDEWEADSLRELVSANLQSGVFTLVVAVDDITEELKRIIEYLNSVTRDEIVVLGLGLPVRQGS